MAYSPEQRANILKKYRQLTASGTRVLDAAKQCGVPYFTISRWMQAEGKPKSAGSTKTAKGKSAKRKTAKSAKRKTAQGAKRKGTRRAKASRAIEAPARFVVTTPLDYRIEADSVQDLAKLLNMLH